MSVLVVGLSHRSAPLPVLERAALDAVGARALASALPSGEQVSEAVVLSTCNRLEVYAEVGTFHGGLSEVGSALAARTGLELRDLTSYLYVHYDEQAVAHLFEVSAGLDSMAVGETQVLGQVRAALRRGQEDGTVGRVLDPLLQQALRVGKRAHTETDLDRVGRSLVEVGLAQADRFAVPLAQARALVVGAGAMSALAATTLQRLGAGEVVVANRTVERGQRLADAVGGTAVALSDRDGLVSALASADVVLSCTGAVGHVLDLETVTRARAERARRGSGGDQLLVDLALPRDVAPEVGGVDGVTVLGLDDLGRLLEADQVDAEVASARAIVAAEVEAYGSARRAAQVGPTVAALRSYAGEVVAAELERLRGRLGGRLDERAEAEVETTVNRVVDKLLHTPTVRMKRAAADGSGTADYAAALRELFDLDLDAVSSVHDVLAVAPTPAPLDAGERR